jgi:hypothetical protein
VLRLEATRAFAKVVLAETRGRNVQGIEMTSFRIECELTELGGAAPPPATTQAMPAGDQQ